MRDAPKDAEGTPAKRGEWEDDVAAPAHAVKLPVVAPTLDKGCEE